MENFETLKDLIEVKASHMEEVAKEFRDEMTANLKDAKESAILSALGHINSRLTALEAKLNEEED